MSRPTGDLVTRVQQLDKRLGATQLFVSTTWDVVERTLERDTRAISPLRRNRAAVVVLLVASALVGLAGGLGEHGAPLQAAIALLVASILAVLLRYQIQMAHQRARVGAPRSEAVRVVARVALDTASLDDLSRALDERGLHAERALREALRARVIEVSGDGGVAVTRLGRRVARGTSRRANQIDPPARSEPGAHRQSGP